MRIRNMAAGVGAAAVLAGGMAMAATPAMASTAKPVEQASDVNACQ